MWRPLGLRSAKYRHARPDAREIVELEIDPRVVRDGKQVQYRVGRTAERDDRGDRVLERFLREDV